MDGCQLEEARRQLPRRPGAQGAPFAIGEQRPRQPGALPRHPIEIALEKLTRLTPGSAPWNRDAHAAVGFHAKQVSPRAPVSDEIKGRLFSGFSRSEREP